MSHGEVYLPVHLVELYGKLVGKYTSPMDVMGKLFPEPFQERHTLRTKFVDADVFSGVLVAC